MSEEMGRPKYGAGHAQQVAWVFYRRAQYRNRPWWSRGLHRLSHVLGWNLCATVAGGYRCVVCGDTRNWK